MKAIDIPFTFITTSIWGRFSILFLIQLLLLVRHTSFRK